MIVRCILLLLAVVVLIVTIVRYAVPAIKMVTKLRKEIK